MVHNQLKPNPKPSSIWIFLLTTLITIAVIAVMCSSIGSAYLNWQSYARLDMQQQEQARQQADWNKLDHAEELAAEGNYRACANVLSEIPIESSYYDRVQQLLDECYRPVGEEVLLQAEEFAKLGELKNAIDIAVGIEKGPLYAEAQQRIESWSQQIIDWQLKIMLDQPTRLRML